MDFGLRVARCNTLRGFEVLVFWTQRRVTVSSRHPYGYWYTAEIHGCARDFGHSENNSLVTPSDVAFRLRKAMKDKGKFTR